MFTMTENQFQVSVLALISDAMLNRLKAQECDTIIRQLCFIALVSHDVGELRNSSKSSLQMLML